MRACTDRDSVGVGTDDVDAGTDDVDAGDKVFEEAHNFRSCTGTRRSRGVVRA